MELKPEDEALASSRPDASITTNSELPGSEPASHAEPVITPGVDGWLALFVVLVALNVITLTYQTLAASVALSWTGVKYGLHDVILVIGLVLVYRRDPLAPTFWRGVLIVAAG
ncbi:MAG TPA: hypothetical protein VGH98_18405 [Gemmatimonadaceae bacterium]|jgi:hypothetical protein